MPGRNGISGTQSCFCCLCLHCEQDDPAHESCICLASCIRQCACIRRFEAGLPACPEHNIQWHPLLVIVQQDCLTAPEQCEA